MTSPMAAMNSTGFVASCATSAVVSVAPRISASLASMSARVTVRLPVSDRGGH